jgi:hypothetical protein
MTSLTGFRYEEGGARAGHELVKRGIIAHALGVRLNPWNIETRSGTDGGVGNEEKRHALAAGSLVRGDAMEGRFAGEDSTSGGLLLYGHHTDSVILEGRAAQLGLCSACGPA